MTEPSAVVPEEVRRLRLEPGDRLIVRVADRWTATQIHEYADFLNAHFPENKVLVIAAEDIAVESAASEQRAEAAGMSDEDIDRLAETVARRLERMLNSARGVRSMPR